MLVCTYVCDFVGRTFKIVVTDNYFIIVDIYVFFTFAFINVITLAESSESTKDKVKKQDTGMSVIHMYV